MILGTRLRLVLLAGALAVGITNTAFATSPFFGSVTLYDGNSFEFETRRYGTYNGGDFYYRSQDSNSVSANNLLANNFKQRGIIDLGVIAEPLNEILPPDEGFYRFGVNAEEGHSYISLVHGLASFESLASEKNFIFFRVTDLTSSSISLDYYYGLTAPVPLPASGLLFGCGLLVIFLRIKSRRSS
ncbi:MAG: hypothetical protein MI976_00355 [Pseudomonadales bacterium]|nr:hypothetical protein [Pseudomonadales bacterium]